jgi:hypothetical protein
MEKGPRVILRYHEIAEQDQLGDRKLCTRLNEEALKYSTCLVSLLFFCLSVFFFFFFLYYVARTTFPLLKYHHLIR